MRGGGMASGDTVIGHLKEIAFVVNTPNRGGKIRSACTVAGVPYFLTLSAAAALVNSLRQVEKADWQVRSL